MDQEFVTSSGKVSLNAQRVLIQSLKFNFWKTAVGETALPAFILSIAFLSFLNRNKPFSYFATAIFIGLFFSTSFTQLYEALFKKSYANYIPVNRVKSFEIKPDEFGLETEVRLHLRNGRYRSIIFRTRESQHQSFTEDLSQYLSQTQFA